MKKVILVLAIIVLAVLCAKSYFLTKFSKEILRRSVKDQQGLNLRIKSLRYDGYEKAFIDGFEVLDNNGQDTVIYVKKVVTTINPFKVHLGLRAFLDIKATGGLINLKKLIRLTHDLCKWEKGKKERISWIYGIDRNAPDQTKRTISFEDLVVKDGKAHRGPVSAPFTIKELRGSLTTDGLKATLEEIVGDLKIESASFGGIIPLPTMAKKIRVKKEKIDLERLGDNKANNHLEPEMCQALTFVAFLLGGKPVVKAAD